MYNLLYKCFLCPDKLSVFLLQCALALSLQRLDVVRHVGESERLWYLATLWMRLAKPCFGCVSWMRLADAGQDSGCFAAPK